MPKPEHQMGLRDPVLHSHIEDMLPDEHPLAFQQVWCDGNGRCEDWQERALLHAANNECMQTWFETGKGNFCVSCFLRLTGEPEVLEEEWGLHG